RQPPPPPPPKDVSTEGTLHEHPLFEALFVVSVEEDASKRGGEGGGAAAPCSSVEAYQRASRQCPPRVVWRFPSSGDSAVREEDVLKFCFPDKEAIKPFR
ncbi:unnamed protein product, partial [Ectocarpus fasciculatus]